MKSLADENLVEANALLSQCFTQFKNKFYKKVGGNGTQANGDSNNSNFSSSGGVMFRDSMKGNVVGKENICLPEAPKLNNVCLVEGISTELNSINKLADQGFRRLRLYLSYLS
ncbi:retrovirus-related Pol polyprotein from transposon TNT 1-94 [Cucumis melo var. makuwa]|uniref:Retrovirus-related Pol polyprotein from transposon TNT 1-94 n=1 Tax=Cucumis melo var. makuwa TaxID=1194695 RepID=A0A5D3DUT5_CUCMM|nr:retrovirus-related Pol polyprotein from transposon TNT 1-94 [Cucumis melo var. makuwa]